MALGSASLRLPRLATHFGGYFHQSYSDALDREGDGLATRIFISWSGDLSRKLGEAVRDWLPASLQYVKPYFSPQDIEKGTKWDSEIAKELEASDIGLVCLTQDNTQKPWILFEAGALSKSIDKSRVCTLLFNLEPAEVKGPLAGFQATRFDRDDFKRLVVTINDAAVDNKLEPAVVDDVFDMWWPKLEKMVVGILGSHEEVTVGVRRPDRDILEEILDLARITASRSERTPRLSTGALSDLVAGLEEVLFPPGGGVEPDVARHVVERLNRPVEYLCTRANSTEAFERWARVKRRYSQGELDLLISEPGSREAKGELRE
jgi:TIR domain